MTRKKPKDTLKKIAAAKKKSAVKKKAGSKKKVSTAKRLSIPEGVKLKVWNDSGGRCEFRGCNKTLWINELTLSNANFGELAHIIGAKEGGPRGSVDSSKLQRDPDNIMLLCSRCHKEVDDAKNRAKYRVELLRDMKKEHEERIRLVTEIHHSRRTEVLVYKCNIDKRIVDISTEEALHTVLHEKYYPKSKGIMLDHTNGPGDGDHNFWNYHAKLIEQKIAEMKDKGLNNSTTDHLSVFALGPMPLLMVLGQQLSDTSINKVELFQRHRDTMDWKWKIGVPKPNYVYTRPSSITKGNHVALVVALSDSIEEDKYPAHLKTGTDVYKITIDQSPHTGFLQDRTLIADFERHFRVALNEIQADHGKDCVVHFMPAMPAPIAVKCGMSLLPKKDVALRVYDLNKKLGGMREVLTLGDHSIS